MLGLKNARKVAYWLSFAEEPPLADLQNFTSLKPCESYV